MNGIERLKKLAEGQEDKSLLKVVHYLLSREDLDIDYLNEEKSIKEMIDYIKGEAKKQAKNGYCWVEDEEVYEWAVKYFTNTNEELGIKKKTTTVAAPVVKEQEKEIVPEKDIYGQLSLF